MFRAGVGLEIFRRIFDAEAAYVWKTLRRLGVQKDDVPDVAQEVWVTVYNLLSEYDNERPIRPWLFGITFRKAVGHKRLARHKRELVETGEGQAIALASVAPQVDAELAARDAQHLVLQALSSIELDRRAVFVMHDMDELSMKDIAETLGIPVNTAYSRLRLARGEFKAAVLRIKKQRGEP